MEGNEKIIAKSEALADWGRTTGPARRKLHDLVRQFRLRYASVEYLSEYLADQVRNRHADSIGRSSKAAHPFLIERIEWESIQA
jgi:hypothetical protein